MLIDDFSDHNLVFKLGTHWRGVSDKFMGGISEYSVQLRTPDNAHSWQSYRAHFTVSPDWETIDLPFTTFSPYRLDTPLDIYRLRRIGIVAIDRTFHADIALSEISFIPGSLT